MMLMWACMDIVSQEGWTALFKASFRGNVEVVHALLAAGVATEAKDKVRGC